MRLIVIRPIKAAVVKIDFNGNSTVILGLHFSSNDQACRLVGFYGFIALRRRPSTAAPGSESVQAVGPRVLVDSPIQHDDQPIDLVPV